jgi:hypothetical protein
MTKDMPLRPNPPIEPPLTPTPPPAPDRPPLTTAEVPLPPLQAKRPPPPLPVRDIAIAADATWRLGRGLALYQLDAAERAERLGYNPADMTSYTEEVSTSVERNPALVPGAPYGATHLRTIQEEIDELSRLRLALEDALQSTIDTMLDRQARRYLLCRFLVEDMRGQRERPFASPEQEPALKAALARITEIERSRTDKAQKAQKKGQAVRAEQGEELSRIEAALQTARSENAQLRRQLEVLSLTAPQPDTRRADR